MATAGGDLKRQLEILEKRERALAEKTVKELWSKLQAADVAYVIRKPDASGGTSTYELSHLLLRFNMHRRGSVLMPIAEVRTLLSELPGICSGVAYLLRAEAEALLRFEGEGRKLASQLPAAATVGIVVDASGSTLYSRRLMRRMLAVAKGFEAAAGRPLRAAAVDTGVCAVDSLQALSQRLEERSVGGGGTAMESALWPAWADLGQPDTLLVLTDGGTKWPTPMPRNFRRGLRPLVVRIGDEHVRGPAPKFHPKPSDAHVVDLAFGGWAVSIATDGPARGVA